MRLTLRTLLAYLDDILEPTQAKEIGEKITESSFATTLVNRIREVMRRRRLTAPDLSGPSCGLEPNVVAEYLDNTLPPDSVADVEKVCLESDIHLAEVAACHQVLTLVLGEPVEVQPQSRERMYALGPITQRLAGGVAQVEIPAELATGDAAGAAENKRQSTTPDDDSAGTTIPDYLRPAPLWRRVLPYVATALVIGIWLSLFLMDPTNSSNFFGSHDQHASVDVATVDAVEPPAGPDAANPGIVPPDALDSANAADPLKTAGAATEPNALDEPASDAANSAVANVPPIPAPIPIGNTVATTPAGSPKVDKPTTDKLATDKPATDKPADDANPNPAIPTVADAADPEFSLDTIPQIEYSSPNGILLRYSPKAKDWVVLAHRSLIRANERVASPEPYDALLDVGAGLCRAELLGGTSLRLLGSSKTALFGFEITEGRIVIQNRPDAAAAGSPLVLAVKIRGDVWRVELLQPGTLCGIEIVRREPDQFEKKLDKDSYAGGFYVVKGSVRIVDATDRTETVEGEGWISLAPEYRMPADPANPLPKPPLLAIPDWLDPDTARVSSTRRRFASLFEKEIDVDQPILMSLPTVVKSPRPGISELAAECLAVTESYQELVKTLAQAEHEESRRAAITGLLRWLPTAENGGELLKTTLPMFFQEDEADVVYHLLWGYNEKDARNRATSLQLIEWMEHENIAIRELAFHHVYRLTGQRYDYRPLSPEVQRRSAVNRWLSHIKKKGALLGPE